VVLWASVAVLGAMLATVPTAVAQPTTAPTEPPEEPSEEPPLPSEQEVMDHLDDLYRAESSHATVTMEVVTENWSRTLTIEGWSLGDDYSLMVVREPSREAGTATLRTEEGLWNYAPRADRLVRVPSGMLSDGWMGSHFTNDDIMRESSYDDDFDTTLSWAVEDGTRYLRAVSVPHPDAAVVWSRIEFFMTADDWIPVRSDYYDGDELIRTMAFSDIRNLGGRQIPAVLEVIPYNEPGEYTRVTYDELELDVDVSASLFTPRGLRRVAQR
jgi:outer membrane lipoprotein-sorting protein